MADVFRWDESAWDDGGLWGPVDSRPLFSLRIDFGRDGTYAPTNALAELTSYAMNAEWRWGLEGAFSDRGRPAEFGIPAELRVQLINRDGAFLPEAPDEAYFGLIRRGQLVRLQATDATGTQTLFVGRLKEFGINPSRNSSQFAELLVSDITLELLDAEFRLPLQFGVTTGVALAPVFEAGLVPWPYASNFMLLDIPGSGELDTNATLYEDTLMDFDAGRTTLAYVGDNLDDGRGISAQGFLRDVLGSEAGGRLFYDPTTVKYVFHDRAHDPLNEDSISTFTLDDFIDGGADYRYGDNLINALTVNYQQRSAGTPGSVLWRYSGVLRLPILGSTTLTIRFTDPSVPGVQTSAALVLPLVPGVDFEAWDNEDLTGDRTARVGSSLALQGNGGQLTITNSDVDDDIYITGLQVRGTPLNAYTMDQRYWQDAQSIADHERVEPAPMDLRVVDDPEFALQVAQATVNRFKDPSARFSSVTIQANQNATLLSHAMRRRVGDKISIISDRIGHDDKYTIVGVSHQLIAAEGSWLTTWQLMPVPQTSYWRIEHPVFGYLDDTARLFF